MNLCNNNTQEQTRAHRSKQHILLRNPKTETQKAAPMIGFGNENIQR